MISFLELLILAAFGFTALLVFTVVSRLARFVACCWGGGHDKKITVRK